MPAAVQVLCGPAWAGKTQRMLERFRACLADAPGGALWLGPTLRAVEALRARLLEETAALCCPRLYTFQDVLQEIVRVNDPAARPLTAVQRRLAGGGRDRRAVRRRPAGALRRRGRHARLHRRRPRPADRPAAQRRPAGGIRPRRPAPGTSNGSAPGSTPTTTANCGARTCTTRTASPAGPAICCAAGCGGRSPRSAPCSWTASATSPGRNMSFWSCCAVGGGAVGRAARRGRRPAGGPVRPAARDAGTAAEAGGGGRVAGERGASAPGWTVQSLNRASGG